MAGHPVTVRGASRTDAGVHADDQVAAFDSEREIPPKGWVLGLNQRLPDDLAVRHAAPCRRGYQPRFDAVRKTYRYLLQVGPARDPRWHRFAWFLGSSQRAPAVAPPAAEAPAPPAEDDATPPNLLARDPTEPGEWLDLGAMKEAARRLEGTHDFRAYQAADDPRKDNRVRTLHEVDVRPGGEAGLGAAPHLVAVDVTGDAFLKNMVRILTGTLVEVGRGRLPPAAIADTLGPDARRADAGPTAPPQGLTLRRLVMGRSRASSASGATGRPPGPGGT
jgi:tRNA pseudouridine38-40 synthase